MRSGVGGRHKKYKKLKEKDEERGLLEASQHVHFELKGPVTATKTLHNISGCVL